MLPGNTAWEIYNGKPIAAGTPLFPASNRALRYGDGLFETFCVRRGTPLYFNDHAGRLFKGIEALHIQPPENFSRDMLYDFIQELIRINRCDNARVRLILFREAGGNYLPENSGSSWHLSVTGTVATEYPAHPVGITAGWYDTDPKAIGPLSNLKTLNSLVYIRAGLFAAREGLEDALIRNTVGNVVESISSNVFIRKGKAFKTPPLSEGCLEGVLRKQLIAILAHRGIPVSEQPVGFQELVSADEVLLTNVIQGVVPVRKLGDRVFENHFAGTLNGWLNDTAS